MKKQYKALMLDVDGTIIENNNFDILPSLKVRNAIKKAQKKLHVGIVTSRPVFLARKILNSLELSGPCITQGGAQIIDGKTHSILREHPLDKNLIRKANEFAKRYGILLVADSYEKQFRITNDTLKDRPFFGIVTVPSVEKKTARLFLNDLKTIPELAIFISPSKDGESHEFVFGTHMAATKQHGILEVAEILDINTHEIIGVGDGYNDFPLLMACGLKVAMGNAVPELKEIADYIAPSVDEDGVAHVIEKFIL